MRAAPVEEAVQQVLTPVFALTLESGGRYLWFSRIFGPRVAQ